MYIVRMCFRLEKTTNRNAAARLESPEQACLRHKRVGDSGSERDVERHVEPAQAGAVLRKHSETHERGAGGGTCSVSVARRLRYSRRGHAQATERSVELPRSKPMRPRLPNEKRGTRAARSTGKISSRAPTLLYAPDMSIARRDALQHSCRRVAFAGGEGGSRESEFGRPAHERDGALHRARDGKLARRPGARQHASGACSTFRAREESISPARVQHTTVHSCFLSNPLKEMANGEAQAHRGESDPFPLHNSFLKTFLSNGGVRLASKIWWQKERESRKCGGVDIMICHDGRRNDPFPMGFKTGGILLSPVVSDANAHKALRPAYKTSQLAFLTLASRKTEMQLPAHSVHIHTPMDSGVEWLPHTVNVAIVKSQVR
ncbi:hypothetical protein DFH09DRAFT_1074729 [Mycena vulgaris]|nr:hypothetical protein DFH09DRAFT_1074729 [Mycena vulgaris]